MLKTSLAVVCLLAALTAAIAVAPPALRPAVAQEEAAPVMAVNLTNMSMADFTIGELDLLGATWLGNPPQHGQVLPQYEARLIRARTEGGAGQSQSGLIVLTGYGDPITLRWGLDPRGKVSIGFGGNEKVNVHAVQVADLPQVTFTLVDKR